MKIKGIITLLILLLFLESSSLVAQEQAPFRTEIQAFKKADSLQPPPQNAILFTGSSSFRLWKNLSEAFPYHTIINRGFGGSSLPHLVQYASDIIFPYNPKQIVVYCGENDLTDTTVSAETVYVRFMGLFALIRTRLGNVPIVFVSMKPSPSRWHLKEKLEEGNRLIKNFLKKQKKATYVDVWKSMLKDDKTPNEKLFLEDMLHMNENGYAIWQKAIAPHLVRQ